MQVRMLLLAAFGACIFSQATATLAQTYSEDDDGLSEVAEPRDGYGAALGEQNKDFSGEELITRSGKVVMYRLEDRYDSFEPIPGSNATFIDMKSGTIRTIVPKRGSQLLLNLDIVFDSGEETAIGYVARTGTRKQYDEGFVDLVIGRFEDLEQRKIMSNVRFVDSPTFVDENSIAMIVWRGLEFAEYTVVDLSNFRVTRTERVDLPEDVDLPEKECTCGDQ